MSCHETERTLEMTARDTHQLGGSPRTGQASVENITVATVAELHEATNRYLAQGFTVTSQTSDSAILVKEPIIGTTNPFSAFADMSPAELVKFFLLLCCCVVPGIVYMRGRLRAHAVTENVVIRVDPSAASSSDKPAAVD